jgi:hypothetical protein
VNPRQGFTELRNPLALESIAAGVDELSRGYGDRQGALAARIRERHTLLQPSVDL